MSPPPCHTVASACFGLAAMTASDFCIARSNACLFPPEAGEEVVADLHVEPFGAESQRRGGHPLFLRFQVRRETH
jgi:hypothetical protein